MRGFSSSWFSRRFCYCVTNRTNDLTGEARPGEEAPPPPHTPEAPHLSSSSRLHRRPAGRDGQRHRSRPRALQVRVHPVRWAGLTGHVSCVDASGGFHGVRVRVRASVSQRNQSTCTYICVMAGRTGQYHTCTRVTWFSTPVL